MGKVIGIIILGFLVLSIGMYAFYENSQETPRVCDSVSLKYGHSQNHLCYDSNKFYGEGTLIPLEEING